MNPWVFPAKAFCNAMTKFARSVGVVDKPPEADVSNTRGPSGKRSPPGTYGTAMRGVSSSRIGCVNVLSCISSGSKINVHIIAENSCP